MTASHITYQPEQQQLLPSALQDRRPGSTLSIARRTTESVNRLLSSQSLMLKEGSAVDATLIAAPGSTKYRDKCV